MYIWAHTYMPSTCTCTCAVEVISIRQYKRTVPVGSSVADLVDDGQETRAVWINYRILAAITVPLSAI